MRVLVTGGAGYIGSHTAKALARAGFEPVVYDNLSEGHQRAVKWGPLVIGDLSDRRRLDKIVRQYHINAVVHFAAHAYVEESIRKPRRYFQNNVFPEAVEAVGRVAKALGATRLIELPEAARARAAAYVITTSEGAALHLHRLRTQPRDFDPDVRDRLIAGALVPSAWVVRAQKFRLSPELPPCAAAMRTPQSRQCGPDAVAGKAMAESDRA